MAPADRRLDDLDHALLARLAVDGRASHTALGRAVGLSRTAVLARVQRLERAGVIRGYRADVALPGPEAAHRARVGIVVRTTDVAAYVRRLRDLGGVREIETVAGEYDFIVGVSAPGAADLDRVLDRIAGLPGTVRTTTWVVLTRYA